MAQRIITRSGTKMIIPTIYGHVVDDSMQNIVSQIEKKARELQAVTEQHDRLMRDNNILINKTEILKQQIKIYEDRIDALSNTKNDVAMKISNNLADYDKRIAEYKKTLSISSETAERLCSLLREIENLLKQKQHLEKEVSTLHSELILAYREFETIQDSNKKASKLLDKDKADALKKDAEIKQLVTKNGKILIQTENNLRLIEHYVKRLQRHYDKAGIKINVLEQFNIKRDTK